MADFSTTAFVFPGQGSQVVGMGKDLADVYPIARLTFEQADDILGFSLSDLCFNGPEADLNDTYNTQPALYVAGIATLRALQSEIPDAQPAFVAGHSLGEFTALAAAGALSFEDGLRLVRERGRLMKAAGDETPGAMAALLGLDAPAVREVCAQASAETGGILVLANDNCPGQVVISGDLQTLQRGIELAKVAGARRAIKLAISIGSHSPLMQPAAAQFSHVLDETPFHQPQAILFSNVTAAPLKDIVAIRHELHVQLVESVRWTELVRGMVAAGGRVYVEMGPKDVLTGLLKRIDETQTGVALNSAAGIQEYVHNFA
jgi:[acyl-carrier-protein] S-malonyltransferase